MFLIVLIWRSLVMFSVTRAAPETWGSTSGLSWFCPPVSPPPFGTGLPCRRGRNSAQNLAASSQTPWVERSIRSGRWHLTKPWIVDTFTELRTYNIVSGLTNHKVFKNISTWYMSILILLQNSIKPENTSNLISYLYLSVFWFLKVTSTIYILFVSLSLDDLLWSK